MPLDRPNLVTLVFGSLFCVNFEGYRYAQPERFAEWDASYSKSREKLAGKVLTKAP